MTHQETKWKISAGFPDMMHMLKSWNSNVFFWPLNTKIASPRRRNSNFHSGVTRLPIEMNVNISNLFLQVLQIPAFCVWAPETLKSISSPFPKHPLLKKINRYWNFQSTIDFFQKSIDFSIRAVFEKSIEKSIEKSRKINRIFNRKFNRNYVFFSCFFA